MIEILVIDNASTDKTKDIAQAFIKKKKFKARYIYEPKLGLSQARNRGIKEAKGQIVVFIDDDAIAQKDWLKNLCRGFKSEDIWAVGGRVKPKFEIKPPNWLPRKYLSVLTICDLGRKIKETPYIMGTNMAFRKKVFQEIGPFRTDLGRRGQGLLGGEELDLCQKITKAGGKILYQPQAIVDHLVPKERLTKKNFSQKMLMLGVSWARIDKGRTGLGKKLARVVFRKPKVLLISLFGFLFFAFTRDKKENFSCWCDFLLSLGYICGSWQEFIKFTMPKNKEINI